MRVTSFLFGIGSIVSGISIDVYVILDYEYRFYAYRYLPSPCKAGSSCPFPGMSDGLAWMGIAMLAVGIIMILFGKITHGKDKK